MDQPNLEKVNPELVAKWCKHYKLDVDPADDLEEAVRALSAAMAKADKIAGCDNCNGDSDIALPECPFCGDSETSEDNETQTKTEVTTEVSDMTTKKKTTKKTAKKAPAKKTSKKAPVKNAPAKTEAAAPKGRKKAPAKKAPAKKAPAKESKALAKKEELSVVSSAALTKGVERVRQLQMQGIECMWDLGQTLFGIYEKKLYTQMKAGTKPVYDSWTKFCKKELGIDPRYGFKLMDVATNFNKRQVADVGVTKLTMLVRVPEEKRAELLAKAKDTPRSKIQEEVSKLAGNTVRDTGRDGFKGKRGEGRKPTKKSEKLTVVRTEPRVVVDLFKRGTTERAKTLEDAMGIEQCANGMTVHYSIVETEKGISLAIETRRES